MGASVSIYSDASFDKNSLLSVLGYAYLDSETISLTLDSINLVQVTSKNNIRAEIKSVLLALENCPATKELFLYTDCETICGLIDRREKLEGTNYISKSKGRELNNADLYKEFYILYDKFKPNIIWVKGHMPKSQQTLVNKNFSILDKTVRSALRTNLK